jgi:hypothetical protein
MHYLGYEPRNLTGRDFQYLSLGALLKLSDEATDGQSVSRCFTRASETAAPVVFLGQTIRADRGVVCFKCECTRSRTQLA